MRPTMFPWPEAPRRDAGARLAALLAPRAPEADALARTLAPASPAGPGVRFQEYPATGVSPTKHIAYPDRFETLAPLLALLHDGDPGALVFALELAARLDPEAAVPVAEPLLPHTPWPMLGQALGRALGRCASARSFFLLVDHPEVPYLRDGLSTHAYPQGIPTAWNLVHRVDLLAPDLGPRARVCTLPALSYLLRHDPVCALPVVVGLLDAVGEVNVYAAHALAAQGPDGRASLCRRLASVPPGLPLSFAERFAVRVLLEDDPRTAVDALGGTDFLLEEPGRPRLRALFDWLRDDTLEHHPEGARGWFTADPRFAQLAEALRHDPERPLARVAHALLRTLPRPPRRRAPRASR